MSRGGQGEGGGAAALAAAVHVDFRFRRIHGDQHLAHLPGQGNEQIAFFAGGKAQPPLHGLVSCLEHLNPVTGVRLYRQFDGRFALKLAVEGDAGAGRTGADVDQSIGLLQGEGGQGDHFFRGYQDTLPVRPMAGQPHLDFVFPGEHFDGCRRAGARCPVVQENLCSLGHRVDADLRPVGCESAAHRLRLVHAGDVHYQGQWLVAVGAEGDLPVSGGYFDAVRGRGAAENAVHLHLGARGIGDEGDQAG